MRTFAVALCLLFVSATADAGIVNVQSILASNAPEGVSGSITGSADWRTGNTNLLLLSAAPTARFRAGDHLVIALVQGDFGRTTVADQSKTIMKKTFEHLRYRYTLTSRLLGEAFAQHTFDEFRRIELRVVAGAGPKYDFVQRAGVSAAVGVAYMLEYERVDDAYRDSGDEQLVHRASSYLTGSYSLDDRVQLVETLYAQPRLTDFGDVRLLNDTSVVLKLTSKVSLTTSFNISYDSEPPEPIDPAGVEIETVDTALKTAISIGF